MESTVSEEKDIFYLFSQIGHFFKVIGKAFWWLITYIFRITYRRWYIILIALVVGVVGAIYYSRPDNRRYKVEGIVTTNGIGIEKVRQMYTILANGLPEEKSHSQSVAHLLGITVAQAKRLSRFKTYNCVDIRGNGLQDYVDYKNSTNKLDTLYHIMTDRLCLQFQTTDLTFVPTCEEILLNYFNSDSVCQEVFTQYKTTLLSERDLCKEQIVKLDDLSTHLYSERNIATHQAYSKIIKTEDITEIEPFQVQIVGRDLQWHLQWLASIEQRLTQCFHPVQLINHLVIREVPVNGTIKCVCVAILIGWILGIIIATLWECRGNITRWLKQ